MLSFRLYAVFVLFFVVVLYPPFCIEIRSFPTRTSTPLLPATWSRGERGPDPFKPEGSFAPGCTAFLVCRNAPLLHRHLPDLIGILD
ncbi:hypothetical protein ACLB2K_056852 [Fragaria x ananassa]